jgi:hypothetical protein
VEAWEKGAVVVFVFVAVACEWVVFTRMMGGSHFQLLLSSFCHLLAHPAAEAAAAAPLALRVRGSVSTCFVVEEKEENLT